MLLCSFVPSDFRYSYIVPIPKPKECFSKAVTRDDFRGSAIECWNFCSQELSLPGTKVPKGGTFVPRNESSMERSFPGTSFPGTFVPGNFRSLELSPLELIF